PVSRACCTARVLTCLAVLACFVVSVFAFLYLFFFLTDPAPTVIHTLSLHDALPILIPRPPTIRHRTRTSPRGHHDHLTVHPPHRSHLLRRPRLHCGSGRLRRRRRRRGDRRDDREPLRAHQPRRHAHRRRTADGLLDDA